MADQTLTFRLVIDGKEAQATLDVTKGQFVETGAAADAANEQVKKAYQDLTAETLKHSQVTETSVKSLTDYISTQNISVDIIQKTIASLDMEIKTLAINSEAWQQKMAASANLKAAMGGLVIQQTGMNASMQTGQGGVNAMNMAMTQFGYILNDSQTFMFSFRMGMMSIANNIPMMIQLMQQAKAAVGGKMTMMQMLTRSIMGPAGLIIGINALLLIMQLLPSLFEDTTKSAEEQKEAIKELKDEYEKLTAEQLKNYIQTREEKVRKLEAKYPVVEKMETKISKTGALETVGTGEFITEGGGRFGKDTERYENLQNEIKALKEIQTDLGVIENIRNRITINQNQLNKLNENEASPFYWKNIVKTAASYEEAKKSLEQWIKADQELIDNDKKREDRFTENKQKAVEKFIQEEFKKTEAARLAGMDYVALMEELEIAENDYAIAVKDIKDSENQAELDANLKLADFAKDRISLITDAAEKEEDRTEEEIENWRKKRKEIWEIQQKILADRRKFENEKRKFFEQLPIQTEDDILNRQLLELDLEEQQTKNLLEVYKKDELNKAASEEQKAQIIRNYEEYITNIEAYYNRVRLRVYLDYYQQKIGIIQNSYSQIYGIISQNVSQEINDWKTKEEKKLDTERDSALKHARTEAQRQKINEEYEAKKEALQAEADKRAQDRLETWFNLQKALAIAEISINLAKAISVEWGKLGVLAAFTQGIVIAALIWQLKEVAAQKFPKGFESGGRLPKGKAGIFEGTANEIVAPESDFKTYSAELVRQALIESRNYISVTAGAGSSTELRAIKDELTGLKPAIERMVNEGVAAYFDDRQAKKVYRSGSRQNRRSKI